MIKVASLHQYMRRSEANECKHIRVCCFWPNQIIIGVTSRWKYLSFFLFLRSNGEENFDSPGSKKINIWGGSISTLAALKQNLLRTFGININLEFQPLPMIAIAIFAKDLSGQLCKTAGWYWVGLSDLMISSWSKLYPDHHIITY